MKRLFLSFLVVVGLFGVLARPAMAQVTINTTTLSTAIASPALSNGNQNPTNQVTLASLGSGATAVLAGYVLYMDAEAMLVRSVPTSGTTVTVVRSYMSTRAAPHAANIPIWYGPSQAFVRGTVGNYNAGGACTSTEYQYLPVIDVEDATIGTCDSTTSRWTWLRLWPTRTDAKSYHPVVNAAYTITVLDEIVAYTSITANRAVTLPSPTGLIGKVYIIKDESGNASSGASRSITFVGTVDGTNNGNAVTTAFGVFRIYSSGSAWFTW